MLYRPDIDEVVDRYTRFHASTEPGAVLVHVFVPAPVGMKYDMRNFRFPDLAENTRFLDAFIAQREEAAAAHLGVRDDMIPEIYDHHGIGLHSAYVAGVPDFSEDTSWSHPVINDWDDLDRLALSPDNPWFQLVCHTVKTLAERQRDRMAVATFYHFSPLDLANALRGNAIFLDFLEAPEQVERLLGFCERAIVWLEDALWPLSGGLRGGGSLWCSWVPGHAVMMSEDAANLCGAPDYPRWAAPWTQRIIDRYDGALIHNHALGMHDQPEIAKLRGLRVLQVTEDPNQPRPIERLADLIAETNGMALQVGCQPDEIERVVEIARGGRIILQTWAPDVATANDIVRLVRKRSAISV